MACSEVVLPLLRKGRAQMGRRGPAELGLSPMGADDVRERFGLGEEEGMKTVRGPRLQSRRLRPTQSFRPESSNSISLEDCPSLTYTHSHIHSHSYTHYTHVPVPHRYLWPHTCTHTTHPHPTFAYTHTIHTHAIHTQVHTHAHNLTYIKYTHIFSCTQHTMLIHVHTCTHPYVPYFHT